MNTTSQTATAAFTHILLTTDFSDNARRAYGAATSIARRFRATVHLAHALEPDELERVPNEDADAARQRVESALRRELLSHSAFVGVEARPAAVLHRRPHRGLEEYAREAGVDLIVTATHGSTGLARFLLGSFAERLVRNAQRPVLVVRPRDGEVEPFVPRAVLVPYDFSPGAAAVLPMVRTLAANYQCTFTFMYAHTHMRATTPLVARIWKTPDGEVSRIERLFEEVRDRQLSNVSARLKTTHGVVEEGLLGVAEETSPDLVLLATHGLLGALSENVLRTLACSVLTVYAASDEDAAGKGSS